jgi:CheY-like chemotaxis protein
MPEASLTPSPPRVLLAEDNTAMRALIAAVLRKDGYEVVEAKDGVELLQEIEAAIAAGGRRNPSIAMIISDIRMPGLTGLDMLAVLRCAYWSTPVILITAFGDEKTHAEAHELGVTAIFDKPFDLDDLRRAVQRAIPPC